MNAGRIAAIVRADFLIRFRRLSTLVVFLLLSALAYVWVPDPATGRALMQVNDQRALYNSAATGVGTAGLATIFIGLAGFYVISNAVKHDLMTRCGSVIASTPMKSMEYLTGKLAGNIVFLATFVTGYMLTAMAMLLVRAEAPLEPLIFAKQYLLLLPPTIVFVSVMAILFESIPWLSGRVGDVAYFFLWASTLGIVASQMEKAGGPVPAAYFDYSSFGYMITNIKQVTGTTHLSIGASNFDAAKGIYVYNGLTLSGGWLLPRIGATLMPLPLLLVARLFFHRFDPARVRASAAKGKRNLLVWISRIFKPVTELLFLLGGRGGTSLLAAARTDALMTLTALPIAIAAIAGLAIAALAGSNQSMTKVMPAAYALFAIVIADIASREKRTGTASLIFAAPLLRQRFVLWKFLSALILGVLFLGVPIARLTAIRTESLLASVTGLAFIAAAATALGIISANPKTFMVGFLSFWYVVVNERGATPSLDFAGFYGSATPTVVALYASLAALALLAAEGWHRWDLRRRW